MKTTLLKFLSDEDFNNRILRGLLRRDPQIDILRLQDTPLAGESDPLVLEWANQEKRILLTHDTNTMTDHAYTRVKQGKTFSGLIVTPQELSIGRVIEDLLILAEIVSHKELENQIVYLPL
jgi:predicted nuclease of predicted toxin-antitoxin system